ncbi:MAG TPA: aminoglycoside phosphotransferase family protein [Natronosporangium sp.]
MRLTLPTTLDWLRDRPGGREWLATLPDTLAEVSAQWSLRVGQPYQGSYVSLVVPATQPDGTAAVLKLQYPEPDSRYEAAALRTWDGGGAVRLLAHDERRLALLLERCEPGTPLSSMPPEYALARYLELLPRLWRPPAGPFTTAEREAARWTTELPARWERAGRPCERRLVDAAVATLSELRGSQGEQVLLNQDLHGGNVLRSRREPWLVIDPKPLIGERELAIASVVHDYGLGYGRDETEWRFARLTAELGLDRDRARGWAFARTLVQAFQDDAWMDQHIATARWLLSA